MELKIDGEAWFLDVARLEADLTQEQCDLHCISMHGEMVIDKFDGPDNAFTGRELWQARPTGYPNAWQLAGMDFEFVRSITMGDV